MHLEIDKQLSNRGLNRYQLSKLINLGRDATYNLCNGNTQRIYFETLENICKVLKCTPNDLFVSDDAEINQLIKKYSQNSNKNQCLVKKTDFYKFMNPPQQ